MREVARRMRADRGDSVHGMDGEWGGVYAVVSGRVQLHMTSPNGKAFGGCRQTPGDMFAFGGFEPGELCQTLLEVTEDGTVLFAVPWPDLEAVCLRYPRVALTVARLEQRGRLDAWHVAAERSLYSVKGRVAHRLHALSLENPWAPVTDSREEIAIAVGTSEEKAAAAIRQLRDEGLVAFAHHQPRCIVLLDHESLRSYG